MAVPFFDRRGKFKPDSDIPDMSGKIILVTGGNTGLGKETILQLVKHSPSKIYMGARNEEKANKAIADIKRLVPEADPIFLQLDVASFQSIEKAAQKFLSENDRLDLLVNNAGIMGVKNGLTADGYEIHFGTNHIGPALLTKLLLPALQKTAAEPNSDVRIVNIGSSLYTYAPKEGIRYSEMKTNQSGSDMMLLYGQTKIANIFYAQALAKRYPSITSVSLHPGLVTTDIVNSHASSSDPVTHFLVTSVAQRVVGVDVPVGALNQLWASTVAKNKLNNGAFYMPIAREVKNATRINNPKASDELWAWTENELAAYPQSKM